MTKKTGQQIYEFETFRLDAASAMLYEGGREVAMPLKAVETLLALVERSGEIVPKDELMDIIWTDSIVEESNLSQYLHLLRKTLGKTKSGNPFIETLKRRGYRFNGEVTLVSAISPPSRRDAEGTKSNFNGGAITGHRSRRIERHGNVLALADWREAEKDVAQTVKTNAKAEAAHPSQSPPVVKTRNAYVATAVFALILVGTLSIILFRSSAGTNSSTVKQDLTFLNLTSGEDLDCATISPDGNYFAYTSLDGDVSHLWLQQPGQANRIEITSPFQGAICGTTFTPDSKSVFFTSGEKPGIASSLYRVPALGGVQVKILTDIGSPVSFSPDGSEMVFVRFNPAASQSSVIIASSDGTNQRVLLSRSGNDATYNSAWSPDGKLIAYSENKVAENGGGCAIVGIDLESGSPKTLSNEKWDNCFRMAWTHDGQGLILIGTKFKEGYSTRRDQIYYLPVADGKSRRLTTDVSRHQTSSLGVTDKDEILVVPFNRLSQIWAMDADGDSRTAVQITKGFADGRAGIAPLVDGRVAYLTRNGDGFSVWMVNGDGSDRKQLTTNPPEIEELRADADGRFFVFSTKQNGRSHLVRVDADGGDLTQLTFGETQEIDSTVSPDGNWVAYDSTAFDGSYGKSALWRIPALGGEPLRLADIDCKTPHFSPDAKFLSCYSDEQKKILIISADNGELVRSLQAPESAVLNVGSRWSPDGKALTYIVRYKNVGNIWLHETGRDAPHPLTDFTSGEIYNFAFSADGSRLYLARGYSTRNAVLISNFK